MKKIFLVLFLTGIFLACDDRMEELNRPVKGPVTAPAETLFANGVKELVYMMTNSNTNINVFRLYAQYWAQTTYPDESQYNMVVRRNPDNFWRGAYRDALKDLDEAARITEETWELEGLTEGQKNNRIAIIDFLKVYGYSTLVDAFGPIPFTESLDPEILQPKYDDDQEVYNSLIDILNGAIGSFNVAEPSFSEGQDLLYEGDSEKWLKFANSLKLKMAVTIADVDPGKAGSMVAEAVAGGVFTSNEDNASMTYLAEVPNTNPVYEDLVQSGRDDYVVANTLIDKLNALNDPRMQVFAEPLEDGVTYSGGIYGSNNTFALRSHIGAIFHDPTLEGLILDYAEVEFMLAEAAARGLGGLTAPETHYNAGIRASMEYWGIAEADITAYLANPDVAYATAAGDWKQKIGTQHWIALYNRGFEGWTVWRRLDFTGFNVPPTLTYADIPTRFIYPIEEATLNNANLAQGVSMLGSADSAQGRVFWDVN